MDREGSVQKIEKNTRKLIVGKYTFTFVDNIDNDRMIGTE